MIPLVHQLPCQSRWVVDMQRKCKTCGETKDHSEYPYDDRKGYRDNIRPHCKVCRRLYENASFHKHKHKRPYNYEEDKDRKLQSTYGISYQEYLVMLAAQQGCCAICGTDDTGKRKAFAVDHCHTSGKVRGLLCSPCNTAIGSLREDLGIMQRAMDYVEFHQETEL